MMMSWKPAFAVSIAIALVHLNKTLHPPGGAIALIAVIGGDTIHQLSYLCALIPSGLNGAIILIIALLVNYMSPNRRYPEFWI